MPQTRPSTVSSLKALAVVWRYGCAGLLPAMIFSFGWILFSATAELLEPFTHIRLQDNIVFMFRATGLIAVAGMIAGCLIGFFRTRHQFGYIPRYLFLFVFGSIVPLLASLFQYHLYQIDNRQFTFDDAALAFVGHTYSQSMRVRLQKMVQDTYELRGTALAILEWIKKNPAPVLYYADPEEYWKEDRCRRLSLGSLTGTLCVIREFVAVPGSGASGDSYWPLLYPPGSGRSTTGLRVDTFLLTGPFSSPTRNDFTGGGGFNFLRHNPISSGELLSLLEVTKKALDSKFATLSKERENFEKHVVMPYWYFMASAVFGFVGSDFALVTPLGFWPVAISVALALYRYLYFAVLVAVFLEPIADKVRGTPPESDDRGSDSEE
ncbi:MAG TPA: hypothetical protein VHC97_08190 [Thermoanaerobaculia bacterium]|jgi:hypothetical protein|nr:hypothetical protein [Thermoanaerobaculia bacterium]